MNCRNSSTPSTRRTWGWLKTGLLGTALALFGSVGTLQSFGQQGLAPYTASRNTGITYSSISGTGTSPAFYRNALSTDDNMTIFLPIGFNFLYDGVQCNAFQMATNGFINLLANTGAVGSGTGAYGYQNDNVFTTAGLSVRVIAPFYDDHQTAGNLGTLTDLQNSMKYQTTGSPGSRICTIEWINIQDFNSSSTSSFNFQIQLFEGSNNILFNYGTMTFGGPGTRTFSLGLNSSTLTGASPFATSMLFTQQVGNTATFGGTQQNTLAVADIPATNSSILFTYGGAAPVPMSGSYTIPGSFASFTAAFNALNYNGVSTPTTINVSSGTYTENAPTLQIGGQTSSVTFQKSGGTNPVISASGGTGALDAGVRMWGGNAVTFDGIDVTASASTLEYGFLIQQYTNLNGAQNCVVQNSTITMNRTSTATIAILQSSTLGPVALVPAGANSSNIFRNINVKNSYAGVQLAGGATVTLNGVAQNASFDTNNQLTTTACGTYNNIGDPATPNDIGNGTTATYGVFMSNQAGFTIANTKVQNVTASAALVEGIDIVGYQGIPFVNNNIIRGIRNSSTSSTTAVCGIRMSCSALPGTHRMYCYNNAISDINSGYTGAATATRTIKGISVLTGGAAPSYYDIYHNSVSINGSGSPNLSSVCLETGTSSGPVFNFKDNIFANFTPTQTGVARHYGVVTTSSTTIGSGTTAVTNNDIYIPNDAGVTGSTAFQTGTSVAYNGAAAWSAAFPTQVSSNFDHNPQFVDATTDLHSGASGNNGSGAPPPGYYTNDLDCATRTPDNDIGAFIINSCTGSPVGGTISPSTQNKCAGQTATMTATGPTTGAGISYQWEVSSTGGGAGFASVSGGSGANTPSYTTGTLSTGTLYYRLSVTCASGPSTSYSNELTVIVAPTPTATAGSNSPVCVGQPLNLTGSTDIGTSFTWSGPLSYASTSQSPQVSASATFAMGGTYVFTATLNGCTSAPSNTVVTIAPAPVVSSTTATPNPACFNGNSQLNVNASVAQPFVRISEFTINRGGTGAQAVYPATMPGADMVELNNTSTVSADVSGWTVTDYLTNTGTNNHPVFTFPASTVIPPNGVAVVCFGTGTDVPASLYFNTGGTSDSYSSGGLLGIVLKNGGTVVDAVGINSGYVFNAGTGVTAGDWSGFASSPSGFAGTIRTGANDTNTGADWVQANTPSPLTSIGTFNAGYNNPFAGTIASYLWTPNTFLSSTTIANPMATGVNVASQAYTVTVTSNSGCTAQGTVTLTTTAPITAATITGTLSFCAGGSTTLTAVPTDGAAPYTYLWSPGGQTTAAIVVTAGGSYSAQVNDGCGGSVNTGSVTVIAKPVPTATAGSNSPVCTGNPLNLTGTTDIGTSFSWTGPLTYTSSAQSPQVSASATTAMSGTYAFTATLNGCTSPVSNTIVVVNPSPTISSTTATPGTICPGGNSQLNVVATTGTAFMSVVPIAYAPIAGSGTAITAWAAGGGLTNDDGFSAPVTIPFTFTLNGTGYTQAWISPNGYLTFLNPSAVTALQARVSSNMTTNTVPNGVVALTYADMIASAGTVSTFTTGTPGNQIFVLDYTNVPFYNGTGSVTGQIQLYENGNKIEVHAGTVNHGTNVSVNALGVENGAGTDRVFAPGRDPVTLWNVAVSEAWRFAPAANTYSWSPSTFLSSTTISNPMANAVTATTPYTVTVTNSLNCSVQGTATVTVATVDDGDPCTLDACTGNGNVTHTFQDADGDLTCDANDGCPNDPNKIAPGICGCGVADTDTDGDLTADCNDGCPLDPLKIAAGICGCGVADTDSDGDGTANCIDGCPADPNKIAPGQCGCGVADTDTDGDATADCNDGCPADPLKIAAGLCGCGVPEGTCNDCEGVPAGPAQPGTSCDDSNACTINDTWSNACVCAGTFQDTDLDGICDANDDCPTLPGEQGDACDDGDLCTTGDVITAGCVCAGTYQDADNDGLCDALDNCPNLAGQQGDACDDGDGLTSNDVIGANCECHGTPCTQNGMALTFDTDDDGDQISWSIVDQITTTTVCQGSGLPDNTTITVGCCLPDGCYDLIVTDMFGDGIHPGGFVLRDGTGQRVIDNGGNGHTFSSVSKSALGFCLPLSAEGMVPSSCDIENATLSTVLHAQPNAVVTAFWTPSNISQQGYYGYQYWVTNPHGGFSRRITLTLGAPGSGAPPGTPANLKPTYFALSSMNSSAPFIPRDILLNVRVRAYINGVYGLFGPACRLRIPYPPCATTQLTTTANPVVSCGATGLTLSSTIYADAVTGATQYQFEFTKPGYSRRIVQTVRSTALNFVTNPLQNNNCYQVRVRVSIDGAQTYCPFGPYCTITIGSGVCAPPSMALEPDNEVLTSHGEARVALWPNPNDGSQVQLSLMGFSTELSTVAMDVTDVFGQVVATRTIPVQDGQLMTTIDFENSLAPGLYLVNLQVGEERHTERLMIQR